MQMYDITAPLRPDLPTFPGEEGLRRTVVAEPPDEPALVSHLALGAHTGTHVDAPVHFLPGGGGVDTLPVDALVGPCHVTDLRHARGPISADDLAAAGVPAAAERLLARTRNSGWSRADTAFRDDYIAYDASAAEWCLEHGVRLLGIDYLSIEPFDAADAGHPVHRMLLGAGVVLLEGVDLADVEPGAYELLALPLLVPAGDGAPARVLLIAR
jgi:arylformamidase